MAEKEYLFVVKEHEDKEEREFYSEIEIDREILHYCMTLLRCSEEIINENYLE